MANKESILEEAKRLTIGDRQDSYGHPANDYGCTAELWMALIKRRYGVNVPLTADFCCLMMAAMKMSREAGKPKRDSRVDLAGYINCEQMCLDLEDE